MLAGEHREPRRISAVMVHGPAFLIPVLHEREGLTLAQAGLVAAAPMGRRDVGAGPSGGS